ncbi:MAG: hypothetical protein RBT24_03840 [Arcobacteraceae bacterium]|jgi:hypothetical protein|nr:hypothetical protein [Arcobacteraceae bacterium]
MDDDERQYWFDILPSMTDSQIDRLFNILETERKKLEKLEIKYQEQIKALNNNEYSKEWYESQKKDAFIKSSHEDKIANLQRELEKAKNDKIIEIIKLIATWIISILAIFFTIAGIINFTFRGLLLNNEKGCFFVTLILLIKYKFISNFVRNRLLKKLRMHLLSKFERHTKQDINLDSNYKKVTSINYDDKNFKFNLIEAISQKYNLLPIILKKDIDLRIGCLDDLLHNIEFSNYLFALDSSNFEAKEQQKDMIDELIEKYPNAKIIIFTKQPQGETKQ